MTDEILHLDENHGSGETTPTNETTPVVASTETSTPATSEPVAPIAETVPVVETAPAVDATPVAAAPVVTPVVETTPVVAEAATITPLAPVVNTATETPVVSASTTPVINVNAGQPTPSPAAPTSVADTAPAAPAKKSKRLLYTILIVLAGVVLFTAIYFLIFPKQFKALIGKKPVDTELVDETDIVTDNSADKSNVADDAKKTDAEDTKATTDVKEDKSADANKDAKATTDNVAKDTKAVKEEPKTTTVKETPSKSTSGSDWGLKRPANIISYGSFKEEAKAKAEVEKLKGQSLNAAYFLMSDIQKGKPNLYKVYVGPFASAKEAKAKLAAVKKVSDKAFFEVVK